MQMSSTQLTGMSKWPEETKKKKKVSNLVYQFFFSKSKIQKNMVSWICFSPAPWVWEAVWEDGQASLLEAHEIC